MNVQQLPTPEAPVLTTMRQDGSRRWLHPRPSDGRFLRRRRIVAYVLIFIFTILPYLKINGKPTILLNIPAREFTLFGFTFLPTDTLLLALFVVSLVVGIFLITAMFGRVWCGWMCPQTVYLEFVYRPLERLFLGPPGRHHQASAKSNPLRRGLMYFCYLLISMFLAHTFLAYFVGIDHLVRWVQSSPVEHPAAFAIMAATTGAMLFDFAFFREQTCIVACPYGRFQSVMLDRDSLIVTYDPNRGEPRGRGRRERADGTVLGDCIDCGNCVDTCPTGIDIRDGLQLECVACTQCIDACDAVMDKMKKPRRTDPLQLPGRNRRPAEPLPAPRVVLYPAIMGVLLTAFLVVLLNKQPADITLLRGFGDPYQRVDDGIMNQVRVKIKNRTDQAASYTVTPAEGEAVQISATQNPIPVDAGQSRTEVVRITVPEDAFENGRCNVRLHITDGGEFSQDVKWVLLGPF